MFREFLRCPGCAWSDSGLGGLGPLGDLGELLEAATASQLRFSSLALAGFGLRSEFGGAFADVVARGEFGGAFDKLPEVLALTRGSYNREGAPALQHRTSKRT